MLTCRLIYGLLSIKSNILEESRSRCLILSGGREYIENPYQFAFGIVLDLVLQGHCGRVCFFVDFKCYFRFVSTFAKPRFPLDH